MDGEGGEKQRGCTGSLRGDSPLLQGLCTVRFLKIKPKMLLLHIEWSGHRFSGVKMDAAFPQKSNESILVSNTHTAALKGLHA